MKHNLNKVLISELFCCGCNSKYFHTAYAYKSNIWFLIFHQVYMKIGEYCMTFFVPIFFLELIDFEYS